MGATTDTIKSNLIAEGFDNPSAEAAYNKIAQGVGILIDNTVKEFANSENNILQTITTQRYGKSGFYTSKAKAFQYGDDLVVDPTTLDDVYAVINPQNQIINQAAFEELVSGNSARLFLKVATVNPITGDLMALSAPQLAAFTAYFVNFEIPGLPIAKISQDPNILNFQAAITYQATYNLSALQASLTAALKTFRQTFDFNGEFFTGDLSDYMKTNVPGIRDMYAFNTLLDATPFGGSVSLPAGYFNYIPNLVNQFTYAPVS